MGMRGEFMTAHAANINTRWFQDQLADRKMSQRKLAQMLQLDPAAVSLMLRGLREIRLEEAAEMARILGIPLDDILAQTGIDLPREGGVDTCPVMGWIDTRGGVHNAAPAGPRHVARPPGAADGTVALRYVTEDWRDGWIAYFRPVDYVMPEAMGRLAVVEHSVTGVRSVRIVKHGYEAGQFRLADPIAADTGIGKLRSASLITWMRQ